MRIRPSQLRRVLAPRLDDKTTPDWKGSANCRFCVVGKSILFLEIANLTTQRSKLRAVTRDTLVNHGWRKSPRYDAYDVAILLTVTSLNRRIDADNVAKALLDALTGLIWHDDRQIRRLLVEKDQGHGPAIRLRAQPHEQAGSLRADFNAVLGD